MQLIKYRGLEDRDYSYFLVDELTNKPLTRAFSQEELYEILLSATTKDAIDSRSVL